MSYTTEQIEAADKLAAPRVKKALTSHDNVQILASIKTAHNIAPTDEIVGYETGLVMLGLTPKEDFPKKIAAGLKLDDAMANSIAAEIVDRIIKPIEADIRPIHNVNTPVKTAAAPQNLPTDQVGRPRAPIGNSGNLLNRTPSAAAGLPPAKSAAQTATEGIVPLSGKTGAAPSASPAKSIPPSAPVPEGSQFHTMKQDMEDALKRKLPGTEQVQRSRFGSSVIGMDKSTIPKTGAAAAPAERPAPSSNPAIPAAQIPRPQLPEAPKEKPTIMPPLPDSARQPASPNILGSKLSGLSTSPKEEVKAPPAPAPQARPKDGTDPYREPLD